MKKIKKIFVLLIATATLASCSMTKTLYDWKGYDKAAFDYTKQSSEESLVFLIGIYEKLIDAPKGTRKVPAPGICADYGYLLIMNGEIEKGKELLVKETTIYPESKIFIDRIIKRFENDEK